MIWICCMIWSLKRFDSFHSQISYLKPLQLWVWTVLTNIARIASAHLWARGWWAQKPNIHFLFRPKDQLALSLGSTPTLFGFLSPFTHSQSVGPLPHIHSSSFRLLVDLVMFCFANSTPICSHNLLFKLSNLTNFNCEQKYNCPIEEILLYEMLQRGW